MEYEHFMVLFVEFVLAVILGLVAFIIRGIKSDVEELKKESVDPSFCAKNHELDAERINNVATLITRVEVQGAKDQEQTRVILHDLTKMVDEVKNTVLKIGHLRRRGDTEQ